MPSEAFLCSHPVIKSSLAGILEINRDQFDRRCRLSVTEIGGGSGFSDTYKLLVRGSGADNLEDRKGDVDWTFFMKIVEGEGMVRGTYVWPDSVGSLNHYLLANFTILLRLTVHFTQPTLRCCR